MATYDRSPVQTARETFANAQRDLVSALFTRDADAAQLKDAQRRLTGGELAPYATALAASEATLQAARAAEAAARDSLQIALSDWLPDGTDEDEDFTRINTGIPIILFPVRLETRFEGNVLHVRVFPDEIFLNTHEQALTEEEYAAAKYYYQQLNQFGGEAALWRDLVARFGTPRSAYILRQMLPIFGNVPPGTYWWQSSSTCGGTLAGGMQETLSFPDDIDPTAIQKRSASWTRPGEAVMPDRWAVVTYSAAGRRITLGGRVQEPLAMTTDPNVQATDLVEIPGTSQKIDKRILWTVDYASALSVGMAIDVNLIGSESTNGLDRVLVVGVKGSMDPLVTSRHLERLLDAHHYTRGMAIVRQGSPTNNTEQRPTPYPMRENAGQTSFVIERQPAPLDREYAHHCLPPETDGYALAMALGVPSGVMANLDRARGLEIEHARQMNTLLWSGTLGYFMRHMMAPVFTSTQVEDARYYFQRYVLGRGPAPVLRIGATPYGVLPIASLPNWQTRTFAAETPYDSNNLRPMENAIVGALRELLEIWTTGVARVPRIRPGQTNPDIDLASVLSTAPNSRQFWLRTGIGLPVNWLLYWLNGWDIRTLRDALDRQAQTLFRRIDKSDWKPRIGRVLFFPEAWLYAGSIVEPRLSETEPLNPNFLSAMLGAAPSDINIGNNVNRPPWASLFFDVVRHSLLREYVQGYVDANETTWIDREVFEIPGFLSTPKALKLILDQIPTPSYTYAGPALNALQRLAGESTAELERLFTETLDLTSYRLDAWVTAVAYRRLSLIRASQVMTEQAPRGDFIGGYAWVEELKPNLASPVLVDGVRAQTSATNGGFVHTPSLTHAAAAAVLRNAHLSGKVESKQTYAVDLSSRRVRQARWLFDGVRNGQPLGALLGYEIERGLHERHPGTTELEPLRFQLRKRFPLVANQGGADPGIFAESIAARNVVDGNALVQAYQTGELHFDTDPDLPRPTTPQYVALKAELDRLVEMLDATADVLTAESTFQLVSGNVDAAVPTINNVVSGKHPPVSTFTRSARGGIGISHRVLLVFPSDQAPSLGGNWPATATARAQAEPVLNAWLGQMIGDPTRVQCRVTYWDANGDPIPNTHVEGGVPVVTTEILVTLADLAIHPLDLFALAEPVARENHGSMLDRRIVAAALSDPSKRPDSTPASIKLDYDVPAARKFPELFEILSVAGAVMRVSRPLAVADLLAPAEIETGTNEPAAEPIGGTNAIAFYLRARGIRTRFLDARDQLTQALATDNGYRAALVNVAEFLPLSAFPDFSVDESALRSVVQSVAQEVERRFVALPDDLGDDPTVLASIESRSLIERGTATLKTALDSNFVALPPVDPPRKAEIALALAARSTLIGADDDAPEKYLMQVERVRERLTRWRKLNIYARTSGMRRPRVDVVQLPYVPGESWLGAKFTEPPTEGRSALLLLNYATALDATVSWCGLVLDDWTEIIPNPEETTGIAFHYEGPKTEAPQSILVAVPSASDDHWTFDVLLASLEQTIKLAKARAVSLEHLDLSQALPMSLFAANPALSEYNVVTDFHPLMRSTFTRGLTDD
jgi:hypothetical protein